jgi:hypothetical protein
VIQLGKKQIGIHGSSPLVLECVTPLRAAG